MYFFFFFFNDTATTEIYTLSLHDALPISSDQRRLRADLHHHGRAEEIRSPLLPPQVQRARTPVSVHLQALGCAEVALLPGLPVPTAGHSRRRGHLPYQIGRASCRERV